jgi:hypothetical protein
MSATDNDGQQGKNAWAGGLDRRDGALDAALSQTVSLLLTSTDLQALQYAGTENMTSEAIAKIFAQHGDHKQRKLILALKKNGADSVTPLVEICEGDYPPSIKRWAVEALGQFPGQRTLKILRTALKSPHMSVRLHAMVGIAEFGERKNIRYIRPMLSDESGGIRMNALEIIARYKPRWWLSEAQKMTRDAKWYIKDRAKKLL